jgi:hypothetical protein
MGAMNHTKTSFSTEIFAVPITSVVQYLAPRQYGQCASRKHSASPCDAAARKQVPTDSTGPSSKK